MYYLLHFIIQIYTLYYTYIYAIYVHMRMYVTYVYKYFTSFHQFRSISTHLNSLLSRIFICITKLVLAYLIFSLFLYTYVCMYVQSANWELLGLEIRFIRRYKGLADKLTMRLRNRYVCQKLQRFQFSYMYVCKKFMGRTS